MAAAGAFLVPTLSAVLAERGAEFGLPADRLG